MATIATNERRRAEKEERQQFVLQLAKERKGTVTIVKMLWHLTGRRVSRGTVQRDIAELKRMGRLGGSRQLLVSLELDTPAPKQPNHYDD